jgi:hypothetical protein
MLEVLNYNIFIDVTLSYKRCLLLHTAYWHFVHVFSIAGTLHLAYYRYSY